MKTELDLNNQDLMMLYVALGFACTEAKEFTFSKDFDALPASVQEIALIGSERYDALYKKMTDYIKTYIPIVEEVYNADMLFAKGRPKKDI
jgi:hypothetical protein